MDHRGTPQEGSEHDAVIQPICAEARPRVSATPTAGDDRQGRPQDAQIGRSLQCQFPTRAELGFGVWSWERPRTGPQLSLSGPFFCQACVLLSSPRRSSSLDPPLPANKPCCRAS